MSLMDRIGKDYAEPGHGWLVWKDLQEKDALPLSFLLEVNTVEVRHFEKSDQDELVVGGEAELYSRGVSSERLAHLTEATGIPTGSTAEIVFFPPGSMFESQMKKCFGDDWKTDCIGHIVHIRYHGKKPNPKRKGQDFHQCFIDRILEVSESTQVTQTPEKTQTKKQEK